MFAHFIFNKGNHCVLKLTLSGGPWSRPPNPPPRPPRKPFQDNHFSNKVYRRHSIYISIICTPKFLLTKAG